MDRTVLFFVGGGLLALLVAAIAFVGGIYLLTGGRNLNPQPANNPGVNNPPAGGNHGWNMAWLSSTPWPIVALVVFVAAFFGALFLRMHYNYAGDPKIMWNVEPVWFYILGAVTIVIVLWKLGSSFNRIPTMVFAYPKLFTVLGFVLVAYALVLVFFPESRAFLLSGQGVGTLLLIMLGYAFFVIIKTVYWKDSKLTALIMMAILLIILDVGITRMIPPAQRAEIHERLAALWPFKSSAGGQVASVTPQCRRVKQEVLFGNNPVKVNQAAACKSDLWFDGHCIYLQRASWTHDPNVYRSCGGLLPKDIEWAWSADAPFVGAVLLSPPEYR